MSKMKAYSIDLREKIVQAYEKGNTSVRKVATNFGVTKSFVQKLLLMKKNEGHLKPKKQGGAIKSELDGYDVQLRAMVEKYPDKTLLEYCEYWATTYNPQGKYEYDVSGIEKAKFNTKKKTIRSSQARTERVQHLRSEYWQQVKQIDPENLVFIDEMGVLLGLTRNRARSGRGRRVHDFKPFYRGAKVTVIGAISLNRVVAVMTLNGSMNSNAFKVFIEKCLLPQLWEGAVVVMDNLPAHKAA